MPHFPKVTNFWKVFIQSRFFLLLFCRREKNIVQNQTITRRVRMQRQIRIGVVWTVLIIFGVVSTIESKKAVAHHPMNITRLAKRLGFPQCQNLWLDVYFLKSRRLPHETFDKMRMILRQHGRYRVGFCRKIKLM